MITTAPKHLYIIIFFGWDKLKIFANPPNRQWLKLSSFATKNNKKQTNENKKQ